MLATVEGHSSAETSKTTTTADIPGTADIQDFGSTSEVSPACTSYYVGRTRLYSFESDRQNFGHSCKKNM
jgi:hypothetical protein